MIVPDDIVIYNEPGTHVFIYPDWARFAIVTIRGGDGGRASDGTPGGPGQTMQFLCRVTEDKRIVPVTIARGGCDWDGHYRSFGGYVIIELYREKPDV